MRRLVLAAIDFVCGSTMTMASETFRCGQWVVSQDVSAVELLKKCGEPTSKTSSTQDVQGLSSTYCIAATKVIKPQDATHRARCT